MWSEKEFKWKIFSHHYQNRSSQARPSHPLATYYKNSLVMLVPTIDLIVEALKRLYNNNDTTVQYSTVHYTTLHYTTLHYATLHYTTLHYTTLHYTTLHYSALHYCTPQRITAQHTKQKLTSFFLFMYSNSNTAPTAKKSPRPWIRWNKWTGIETNWSDGHVKIVIMLNTQINFYDYRNCSCFGFNRRKEVSDEGLQEK